MNYLQKSTDILANLIPDPLIVLACLAAMALVGIAGGGIVGFRMPALSFAAGAGAYALLLTVLGILGSDLRVGVAVLAMAAIIVVLTRRDHLAHTAGIFGKAVLLALPLLLLLSDRNGSEWDEFSHWLHGFRYLATNHVLPGGPDAPAMASCCAAYPYGWPMIGYLTSLVLPFSEAVPAVLNTVTIVLMGILLAQLIAEETGARPNSFKLLATGILFASLASPTFVSKLVFSAYADLITGFLVAVMVVLAERLVNAAKDQDQQHSIQLGLSLGLTGAFLLAVKPGNLALLGCVAAGGGILLLRLVGWRGIPVRAALAAFLIPIAGALAWRWHVGKYLDGQELVIRSVEQWNHALIPDILLRMAEVASQKGGYFALAIGVVILGAIGLRRCQDRLDRLAVIGAILFLGYNLFLLFTYVAVFGEADARRVASYWRYNTHLGLALTIPAIIFAARYFKRFSDRRWMPALGSAAIVIVLVGPLAALPSIRFDQDPAKRHVREAMREIATIIPHGQTAAIYDPLGSGLSNVMAAYEWNGAIKQAGILSAFSKGSAKQWMDGVSAQWLVAVSGHQMIDLPEIPAIILLRRDGSDWEIVREMNYPGDRLPKRHP